MNDLKVGLLGVGRLVYYLEAGPPEKRSQGLTSGREDPINDIGGRDLKKEEPMIEQLRRRNQQTLSEERTKMAAPRVLLRAGHPAWWGGGTPRTLSTRSNLGQGPNPSYDLNPNRGRDPQKGLMARMASRFSDVEQLQEWIFRFWSWNLYRKNKVFSYTLKHHGPDVAAAHFVLTQGGAVRFQDHEWILPQNKNRFLQNCLSFQKLPLEEVDASGCVINYYGLENLVFLPSLRSLRLCGCPYVDDWCLSRLHSLGGSLQELSLAGCPRVTERGLACLHHLWNLRRLDISNLPALSNKGLTQILVEEMLPDCEVVGADYADGLEALPEEGVCVEEKVAVGSTAAIPGAPAGLTPP